MAGFSANTRPARRSAVMLALTALLLGMQGGGSAGAASGHRAFETFAGSCDLAGEVTFDPGLGTEERATRAVADADGTCSGTYSLRGRTRELEDAPVAYHAVSKGDQSCTSASASGKGFLRFGKRRLRFTLSETRVGVVAQAGLTGRGGGSFSGTAVASGDPVEALESCAEAGLESAEVGLSGQSQPSITG